MVDFRNVMTVVGDLLRLASEDVVSDVLLEQVCRSAADLLELDDAGLATVDPDTGRLTARARAGTTPLDLAMALRDAMIAGPCRDALANGSPVEVHERSQMAPWPPLVDAAARAGITAVVAVPLVSRGRGLGVLYLSRSSRRWPSDALVVARLLADGVTALLVVDADRTEALLAQVQLRHQSTHDLLTGLPNRVLLFERLHDLIAQATADVTCVAACFVDLEDFRRVNTVWGRRAGDEVLREVSRRLDAQCADGELVARLDGDKFVVVLPGLRPSNGRSPVRDARSRAIQIHEVLSPSVELESGSVQVSARVGVAIAAPGMSGEELVDEADHAVFEGLQSEPTLVTVRDFCVPGGCGVPLDALPSALEDDALAVHYQPIVSPRWPHRPDAVEALLRWRGPDGSTLPAESFITAAIRNGLMPAFGSVTIDRTCAQLAAWRAELGDHAPGRAFVNLSARELNDPALPGTLDGALRRHGLTEDDLGLEIVEESLVHDGLVHRLRDLRRRGHHLAIDDFGTGYSSLARLSQVHVDVVKIDRSLVADLALDPHRVDMMRAVVDLARSLEVDVVAEGVETLEQLDRLAAAGVDRVQGHLFGQPMPADDLAPVLAHHDRPVVLRHVLTGRAAITVPLSVGQTLRTWFGTTAPDIDLAVIALQEALELGGPTRRWEKYLGIDVTRDPQTISTPGHLPS